MANKKDTDDVLETVAEVMAALKISRSFLYSLIRDGKIKAVKVGNATRFARSERIRFMRDLPRMHDPDS